ncbi:hypothetical protein AYI70_g8221 [Smittium culicis]|uniref:Charged multivesicular body protein 7 n=1 Tax=Smittium culicis TaxID=133412 RepID=A0A1R1XH06_9FUNG|nr:hypothetical protein AYI70_g8221 [Smittium culicis]
MEEYLKTFSEIKDEDRRAALYSDLNIQKDEDYNWYKECMNVWEKIIVGSAELGYLTDSNSSSVSAEKNTIMSEVDYSEVIKFVGVSGILEKIRPLDIQILDVIISHDTISSQISKLQSKSDNLREKAIQQTSNKTRQNKSSALANLKLSKHIELNLLPSLNNSLVTLNEIITRIEKSSSEADYLEAIETGTKALVTMNKLVNVENVEYTFEQLTSALADQDEIDSIINTETSNLNSISSIADEQDLMSELEELISSQSVIEATHESNGDSTKNIDDNAKSLKGTKKDKVAKSTKNNIKRSSKNELELKKSFSKDENEDEDESKEISKMMNKTSILAE